MSSIRAPQRPRRIASDEAHAWARNLRLGNLQAKIVLSMLSLYIDGEGVCFVGIPQLAEDCELSPDTVRRRLSWLQDIGAISRQEQWIDGYGNRNGQGRGKRTTDRIVLLIGSDVDAIEARAAGRDVPESPIESTSISPGWQQGLDVGPGGQNPQMLIRTRLALGQPSHCGEGLISEPEPESIPPSPLPGGSEGEGLVRSEQEPRSADDPLPDRPEIEPPDFEPAWSQWVGREVMRRDLALGEFRRLSTEEQRHCRAAVPLFNQAMARHGRTKPPNFHLWIRNRGFAEFPQASGGADTSAMLPIEEQSEAGRAVKALYAVARTQPFVNHGHVIYPLPITPRILAFAQAPPQTDWLWIEDRQQIAAWQALLAAHVRGARPPLITERDGKQGFAAPWPWPPRKDGTISQEASPEQAGETA